MSGQTLLPKLSVVPSVMLECKDANEAEPRVAGGFGKRPVVEAGGKALGLKEVISASCR